MRVFFREPSFLDGTIVRISSIGVGVGVGIGVDSGENVNDG